MCRGLSPALARLCPLALWATPFEKTLLDRFLCTNPAGGAKKKASRKTCFFLSNPKDWHGITARSAVHGIRRIASAWHTPACLAALRALFRQGRNVRGAICARLRTSTLVDSLRLITTRQCVSTFGLMPYKAYALIPYCNKLRIPYTPSA